MMRVTQVSLSGLSSSDVTSSWLSDQSLNTHTHTDGAPTLPSQLSLQNLDQNEFTVLTSQLHMIMLEQQGS